MTLTKVYEGTSEVLAPAVAFHEKAVGKPNILSLIRDYTNDIYGVLTARDLPTCVPTLKIDVKNSNENYKSL